MSCPGRQRLLPHPPPRPTIWRLLEIGLKCRSSSERHHGDGPDHAPSEHASIFFSSFFFWGKGWWKSQPSRPLKSSMPMTKRQFSAISMRRRAPCAAMTVVSGAEVGIDRDVAGESVACSRKRARGREPARSESGIQKRPGLSGKPARPDQGGIGPAWRTPFGHSETISQMARAMERRQAKATARMEVSARQGLAGVGEDQRIVGHAVLGGKVAADEAGG